MVNRITEIQSFLSHADYSLAVRRMLDVSLDCGDSDLLHNAINWSKTYHAHLKVYNEGLPDNFFSDADALIQQLQSFETSGILSPKMLMNVEHISKQYSSSSFSLKPISLQIKTGDILGIVGENGNGKTTLLRCLSGELSLDSGSISYTSITNPDYYNIKGHVAFIPQRIPKWHGLLKDNLHFSASLAGITGAKNELMVDFMLERLNLTDYAHLTWSKISSGYRTRFEIARILLQQPSLLVLDEPLANLDINAQQTILTDLRYLAKSVYHPMGIILSSQQLHEVEKVADNVLLIKQGSCLFRTSDNAEATNSAAIEIETDATRDTIINILGEANIRIQYNGGFYTITSSDFNAHYMVSKLLNNEVPITYFRDITNSTKRFF